MNFIGWVIPLIIISIVFNVISKAAKQVNQQRQNQAPGNRPDMQQSLRQQAYERQQPESMGFGNLEKAPLQAPGLKKESDRLRNYTEGDPLNRYSLEGLPLEGISLENAKSPDRITPTADSAYEVARRAGGRDVGAGNSFMNRRSVVNGVIMSEVLSARGGRKRVR